MCMARNSIASLQLETSNNTDVLFLDSGLKCNPLQQYDIVVWPYCEKLSFGGIMVEQYNATFKPWSLHQHLI